MSVPMGFSAVAATTSSAAFSAALLVFAFGIRRAGSVTHRRPLGTTAITVLALWTLLSPLLSELLYTPGPDSPALFAYGYADALIQALASLIAVAQIGRIGVIPHPWRWAPAWVLAATAVPTLLTQTFVFGDAFRDPGLLSAVVALQGLVHVGGTILLGVLALVLAERMRRPRTVPVFRGQDSSAS